MSPAERVGKKPTSVKEAPPPNAMQTADLLVDYTNGKLRNNRIDLVPNFTDFVSLMKENPQIAKEKPILVLSSLAAAMIRKTVDQAISEPQREFAFSIRGVRVPGEKHDILVGAYTVPAMDFTTAQSTKVVIDPELEGKNAKQLAEQTNLRQYFQDTTGFFNDGAVLSVGHTHPTGDTNPSQYHKEQIEKYFEKPEFTQFHWLVVTKGPDGKLITTAVWSHRDQSGTIIHEQIPVMELAERGDTTSLIALE